VKNLEYWKIMALVGTIVFLFSVFIPYASVSAFGITMNRSLENEYQDAGRTEWNSLFANYPAAAVGLLMLMILWPIALILGILSIFKRKTTLIAGVVGIVCWVGAVMYISGLPATGYPLQYGAGMFTGFAGAIILLIACYIKPTARTPQAAPPPPPPSAQISARIPTEKPK
jgi:hypothetical protein